MMTLSIAELADGRRALAYLDPDGGFGKILCILQPHDLEAYKWRSERQALAKPYRYHIAAMGPDGPIGSVIDVTTAQPLPIPPKPQPKRITPEDLLKMAREREDTPPAPPKDRKDELLRRIDDLRDDA